MKTSNINIYRS